MIDRRKFLRAALFVAAAPVIVKASSLMPIRAPKLEMIKPLEYTAPSAYLRALIESIERTKEMVAVDVLNYGFGFSKIAYVDGKIAITRARLHEQDLAGVIDLSGDYKHLTVPMTYEGPSHT